MMAALRQAWDRISLYLPVILMGLLALGSWWLVRNAPVVLPPAPERAPTHQPDYYLKNFSVKSFDASGSLHSEVRGEMARHFPDTDTLEIDNAHLRAFDAQGRRSTATAQRALSNGDGSEVQLFGNAVVTREAVRGPGGQVQQPQLEFRGEFLHAWLREERVRSDQPVTLTRGNDRFTADSLDYNHLDQVLQLQGRVRGVLQPPARRP